jgi:hypothetical protein
MSSLLLGGRSFRPRSGDSLEICKKIAVFNKGVKQIAYIYKTF